VSGLALPAERSRHHPDVPPRLGGNQEPAQVAHHLRRTSTREEDEDVKREAGSGHLSTTVVVILGSVRHECLRLGCFDRLADHAP